MGARPSLALVAGAAFLAHWTLAFVSSLSESIWQTQVQREMQGRIFALKQTSVQAGKLGAYLVAALLADRFLEPMLHINAPLAGSLGAWFGVGPGRGIAVLFFLIGLIKALFVIWIYASAGASQLDQVFSVKAEPT